MSYIVYFRGRPACPCLAEWLPWFERVLIKYGVIKQSIDIAQLIGGAAASAGTHRKGGAYDIWQHGSTVEWISTQMGGDGWTRRPPAFSLHFHGILRDCPHNGAARYQLGALDRGYNGLGGGGLGGRDDGHRPAGVRRSWREGIEWAKRELTPPKALVKKGDEPMYPVILNKKHYYILGQGFISHLTDPKSLDYVRNVFTTEDVWHVANTGQFHWLLDAAGVPRNVVKLDSGFVLDPSDGKFKGGGVWSWSRIAGEAIKTGVTGVYHEGPVTRIIRTK